MIVVEDQPDAPARLSIQKAICSNFSSEVELLLENISDRTIRGFEVSQIQDYEIKKGSQSGRSLRGYAFKPGESVKVAFSGGFVDGTSYGQSVGHLQKDTYRISWIEFSDGGYWGKKPEALRDTPKLDLSLRDDREPFIVAFQYKDKTISVMSCDEYAFGGPGLAVEAHGCITRLSFDFPFRREFSYHPRKQPDVTMTIKAGDNLHGEFTYDRCAKTAQGFIRDDNQNLMLMNLSDTDTSGKWGYCTGPPDYK